MEAMAVETGKAGKVPAAVAAAVEITTTGIPTGLLS
jgi:hypothetical protein